MGTWSLRRLTSIVLCKTVTAVRCWPHKHGQSNNIRFSDHIGQPWFLAPFFFSISRVQENYAEARARTHLCARAPPRGWSSANACTQAQFRDMAGISAPSHQSIRNLVVSNPSKFQRPNRPRPTPRRSRVAIGRDASRAPCTRTHARPCKTPRTYLRTSSLCNILEERVASHRLIAHMGQNGVRAGRPKGAAIQNFFMWTGPL